MGGRREEGRKKGTKGGRGKQRKEGREKGREGEEGGKIRELPEAPRSASLPLPLEVHMLPYLKTLALTLTLSELVLEQDLKFN